MANWTTMNVVQIPYSDLLDNKEELVANYVYIMYVLDASTNNLV